MVHWDYQQVGGALAKSTLWNGRDRGHLYQLRSTQVGSSRHHRTGPPKEAACNQVTTEQFQKASYITV